MRYRWTSATIVVGMLFCSALQLVLAIVSVSLVTTYQMRRAETELCLHEALTAHEDATLRRYGEALWHYHCESRDVNLEAITREFNREVRGRERFNELTDTDWMLEHITSGRYTAGVRILWRMPFVREDIVQK